MICDNCKVDKLDEDFVNSKNICYKCLYRIKLEKISQKRTLKNQTCRICGSVIIHKKNVKKRQRTSFCSFLCAEKGHKDQLKNYWTRQVCGGSHKNRYVAGIDV